MKIYFIKSLTVPNIHKYVSYKEKIIHGDEPTDLFFIKKSAAAAFIKRYNLNNGNKSVKYRIVSWRDNRALKFLFNYILYANKIQPLKPFN